ncbi:MAG: hypothetical protein AB1807_06745 [Pseudomonadota bacterium]
MTSLAFWTLERITEWETFSPTPFAASPDASYSIANLYLRFGYYIGACCGVALCSVAWMMAGRRRINRGISHWRQLIAISVPALVSIALGQQA